MRTIILPFIASFVIVLSLTGCDRRYRGIATAVIGPRSAADVLAETEQELLSETADIPALRRCLALCLLTITRAGAASLSRGGRSLAS